MQWKALEPYATPRQLEYIEAIRNNGSNRKAAEELGINRTSIDRSLQSLKVKAAIHGWAPGYDLTHPVAPGQKLKGASTLYKDGQAVLQWVKSTADEEAQKKAFEEALEALAEDLPRLAPVPGPKLVNTSLCNVYTMTDCHIGMLAWRKEGGSDWDLKIAEESLIGCFEQMVLSSPPADICVVAQLGDFLHYDSLLAAVTPMHGHSLDSDGRMPKMVNVAIRILRKLIDIALRKHRKVILLLAEGNHDVSSSVWLRAMFSALYENEDRIEVIESELPYYVYQHGETMLGWHHGHLKKNEQLPLFFAAQFPKVWGDTSKRYAHTGHRHHKDVKEHAGMTVQQHTTIASRDAYAARGGWMSERGVEAITYHRLYGQVGTVTIIPEMLEPDVEELAA